MHENQAEVGYQQDDGCRIHGLFHSVIHMKPAIAEYTFALTTTPKELSLTNQDFNDVAVLSLISVESPLPLRNTRNIATELIGSCTSSWV